MLIRWYHTPINSSHRSYLRWAIALFFILLQSAWAPSTWGATVKIEGSIPISKPVSEISLNIVVSSIEPKDQLADYRDIKSYLEVLVKGNNIAFTAAEAQNSNNKYLATYEDSIQDPKPNNFTVTIKIKLSKLSGTIDDDLENNNLRMKVRYKKDSESPETLISRNNLVFTAAPTFSTEKPIVGSHKQLLINAAAVDTVSTSSGQPKTPSSIYVYAFKAEEGVNQEFELPARVFEANNDNPRLVTCKLTKPESNLGECIKSCQGENTERNNVYLDHKEIANKNIPELLVASASINPGKQTTITLGGLENQKKYFIVLTYDQGTRFSSCLAGEPSINYTLTELNGEAEATIVDLRCFIASAAYGSPLAQELRTFRWFRDHVLQKSVLGRLGVKTYYLLSPTLAQWVRTYPTFRLWALSTLEWVRAKIQAQMPQEKWSVQKP